MIKAKEKKEEGAPAYMLTYGDMMTLLLCFFVILVAMSEIKEDKKYEEVVRSIQEAFGFVGGVGQMPTDMVPRNSALDRSLNAMKPHESGNIGEAQTPGLAGRSFRVSQIREGFEIAFGGPIPFQRSQIALASEASAQVAEIAEKIRGHTTKIDVKGHASAEPLSPNSTYRDLVDLSFERARIVASALAEGGVDPSRIRVVAVGDNEPLLAQAYDERRRAVNRRVEIIVRESLVAEFSGDDAGFEEK